MLDFICSIPRSHQQTKNVAKSSIDMFIHMYLLINDSFGRRQMKENKRKGRKYFKSYLFQYFLQWKNFPSILKKLMHFDLTIWTKISYIK
jgi:hypothetical protein